MNIKYYERNQMPAAAGWQSEEIKNLMKYSEWIVTSEIGREIQAMLIAYRNSIHPGALYLKFAVYNKGRDVFQALFNKLKSISSEDIFIFSTEVLSKKLETFLVDNHFIEMRRTYEEDIDIETFIDAFPVIKKANDKNKYVLKNADIIFIKEVYEYTHRIHPPKNMNTNQWRALIEDGISENFSVELRDKDGVLSGYILIYEGETLESLEIGYCYFKDDSVKELLKEAFSWNLRAMKKENVRTILLEADTSDCFVCELFHPIINDITPDLYTFRHQRELEFELLDIEDGDYITIHEWNKDREFCESIGWSLNSSMSVTKKWWEGVIKKQSDQFKRQKIIINNTLVGYIDRYNEGKNIEIGIAIGDQRYRGNGLGTNILSRFVMALSHKYPDKKIFAATEITNHVSQRMLVKAGFKYSERIKDECRYIFERYRMDEES